MSRNNRSLHCHYKSDVLPASTVANKQCNQMSIYLKNSVT